MWNKLNLKILRIRFSMKYVSPKTSIIKPISKQMKMVRLTHGMVENARSTFVVKTVNLSLVFTENQHL